MAKTSTAITTTTTAPAIAPAYMTSPFPNHFLIIVRPSLGSLDMHFHPSRPPRRKTLERNRQVSRVANLGVRKALEAMVTQVCANHMVVIAPVSSNLRGTAIISRIIEVEPHADNYQIHLGMTVAETCIIATASTSTATGNRHRGYPNATVPGSGIRVRHASNTNRPILVSICCHTCTICRYRVRFDHRLWHAQRVPDLASLKLSDQTVLGCLRNGRLSQPQTDLLDLNVANTGIWGGMCSRDQKNTERHHYCNNT